MKNKIDLSTLRIDLIFSYWIFFWFILYYITLYYAPKTQIRDMILYINPIIGLIIALIENFINIFLIYKNFTLNIFFKYILMLLFVKVLPIYLLRNIKIHIIRDIIGTIMIFIIYLGWLYYNNTTLWEVYSKTLLYISRGENKTPFFMLLKWLEIDK